MAREAGSARRGGRRVSSGGPGVRGCLIPAVGAGSEIWWPARSGLSGVCPGVRCEKKVDRALSRRGALRARARHVHTECAIPVRTGDSHSQGAWPGGLGIRTRLPAAVAWLVGTQDGVPRLSDGPFCTCAGGGCCVCGGSVRSSLQPDPPAAEGPMVSELAGPDGPEKARTGLQWSQGFTVQGLG